jgi:putative holliday junction resolvase
MNEESRIQGRLLGIDHGLKRIGIAVSDSTGQFARELDIINRTTKQQDFAQIKANIERQGAIALVIGCPLDLERAEQGLFTQADKVRNWVEHLRTTLPLPIVLWDETMTSVDARELARSLNRRPEAAIDDIAARLMLQSYLDAVREGLAEVPR